MVATAVVCGGAHAGALSCSLLQRQWTGPGAGFRVHPVPMPLLYSSRERQSGPGLPYLQDLRPSRETFATKLRAGADSEHLGVLNGEAVVVSLAIVVVKFLGWYGPFGCMVMVPA